MIDILFMSIQGSNVKTPIEQTVKNQPYEITLEDKI